MIYGPGSTFILIALIFAAIPIGSFIIRMGETLAATMKDREEEYD